MEQDNFNKIICNLIVKFIDAFIIFWIISMITLSFNIFDILINFNYNIKINNLNNSFFMSLINDVFSLINSNIVLSISSVICYVVIREYFSSHLSYILYSVTNKGRYYIISILFFSVSLLMPILYYKDYLMNGRLLLIFDKTNSSQTFEFLSANYFKLLNYEYFSYTYKFLFIVIINITILIITFWLHEYLIKKRVMKIYFLIFLINIVSLYFVIYYPQTYPYEYGNSGLNLGIGGIGTLGTFYLSNFDFSLIISILITIIIIEYIIIYLNYRNYKRYSKI